MSNATHYIIRRLGQDVAYNYIEDATEAVKKKMADYPSSTFFVFSADRKIEAEQPKLKIEQLGYDWNVNCKSTTIPTNFVF